MRSTRARSSPEHRCEGVRTHRGLPALRAVARRGAGHPINGLGGPAGLGRIPSLATTTGPRRDRPRRGLSLGRQFFGVTYTSTYVNNNGNITFGGPVPTYTPSRSPSPRSRCSPVLGTSTRGRGIDASRQNLAYYHVDATGRRFIVTWYDVGYFASATSRLDSFQLILTNRDDVGPGDFDVEYRFNRCEWTTGDASGGVGGLGGTEAQMGWDAGDLTNFWSHPTRRPRHPQPGTTSNVGDPGVWRFRVRSATP